MYAHKTLRIIAVASFFLSQPAFAQVVLSEIMYDLPGTDTGREWVEITNTGSSAVTVSTSTWKFFEANTNHGLSLFQGSVIIPGGGFAVIADDPSKFLIDWPEFTGTIFGSTFSLANTAGEFVAIKSSTTTMVDQLTYDVSLAAAGDGSSLQKVSGIWIAGVPTPGAVNSSSTGSSATPSNQTADTSASTTDNSASSTEDSTSVSNNNSSWPVDPQLLSRIIGPTTGISGADIVFHGEAIGLDKKPIANARFLWNFGDGASKEGEAVLHVYNFPGDYVVILDVSSGKFSATSRTRLKIISADIVVSVVEPGPQGRIDLVNNSNQELDLSWWRLESNNQFFSLPKNTKILAYGKLPLSSAVTGLNVNPQDVALLYPNGSVAYRSRAAAMADSGSVTAPAQKTEAPTVISDEAPKISPTTISTQNNQKISPELVVAVASPPPPSQAAATLQAFDEQKSVEKINQSSEKDTSPSSPTWLYGAVGIIILGLGFVLLPKSAVTKNPADDFTIVE